MKWEYKIENRNLINPPTKEKQLNFFGNLGWELVDVILVKQTVSYYFKRQIT